MGLSEQEYLKTQTIHYCSCVVTCLLELLNNENHKLRQKICPKCHIDEKSAMSRFSASGMVLRSQ